MIPDLPQQQKIFGLDAMRVLAILLVLSAHCLWIFEGHKSLFTKIVSFSGFMGVEIFFVLSGYLIGGSLYRIFTDSGFDYQKVRRFLKRRSLRIMPSYLLILCVNLVVAFLIGLSVDEPWKYFLFLQNFAHPMLPFFPESWSMSIKEIPYFIIPFGLLVVAAVFRGIDRGKLFFIFIFMLYLSAIGNKIWFHVEHSDTMSMHDWNISLRSVFVFRYDAVLTGVLFFWLRSRFRNIWANYKWHFAILGILLFGSMAFITGVAKLSLANYPFFWNVCLLPLLSLASAMSLPFFSEWTSASVILDKPVTFLGNISYSIYLIHYSLVLWLMKQFFPTANLSVPMLFGYMIIYLSITIGLSWLLYSYYEKPILKWRMRLTKYGQG
ncbi:acyltransferase family protein [Flavobacterium silvaticum]|uniref:Acyltransferase n=1 Tax=Flavobacterium silvaticum TaxID=1852020 RepID=A0A972JHJ6_9FLAO|nr:acyltransferase [Flavobacterium silvaticum]NMH28005.1 acyltransferase [Flavobacterium silvaticum]